MFESSLIIVTASRLLSQFLFLASIYVEGLFHFPFLLFLQVIFSDFFTRFINSVLQIREHLKGHPGVSSNIVRVNKTKKTSTLKINVPPLKSEVAGARIQHWMRDQCEDCGSHWSSLTMLGSDLAPSMNSSRLSLPSMFLSIWRKILSVRFSGVLSSSGIFMTEPTIL